MAETYRIYDYKQMSVGYLAILVNGLGADSRVAMKRAGWKAPPNTVLLAVLCDIFETYVMALGGEKNANNRAERLMIDYEPEKHEEGMTIEEFEARRAQALEG